MHSIESFWISHTGSLQVVWVWAKGRERQRWDSWTKRILHFITSCSAVKTEGKIFQSSLSLKAGWASSCGCNMMIDRLCITCFGGIFTFFLHLINSHYLNPRIFLMFAFPDLFPTLLRERGNNWLIRINPLQSELL